MLAESIKRRKHDLFIMWTNIQATRYILCLSLSLCVPANFIHCNKASSVVHLHTVYDRDDVWKRAVIALFLLGKKHELSGFKRPVRCSVQWSIIRAVITPLVYTLPVTPSTPDLQSLCLCCLWCPFSFQTPSILAFIYLLPPLLPLQV